MAVTGVMAATDTDMEARANRAMAPHRPCLQQGLADGIVADDIEALQPPAA